MSWLNTVFRSLLCSALFVAPAIALAAEPLNGEALLRHFVDDMQTLSATFEQTLVDADDNVVEESEGTVELSRPGRFRWTYTAPYEQLLVADGLNIWSYDADLAQVTVKPQAEVLSNTPAILLGGGGDVFNDFTLVDSFSDRGVDWLRLTPATSDGGFESVDLGFQDGILSRMIFLDALGQSTLIALFDVAVNEPVAAGMFTFEVPDDVDLVGEPLTSAIADQ
ncbi:MAG: outer membrane lipoprotein chaperone LolA [Woeseia sp.]